MAFSNLSVNVEGPVGFPADRPPTTHSLLHSSGGSSPFPCLRKRHEKIARPDFFHLGRGVDPRTVQLIDSRHRSFVALPCFCEQMPAFLQLVFCHRRGERGLPLGPFTRPDRPGDFRRFGWDSGDCGGLPTYLFMGLMRPVTSMRSYFDFTAAHFFHDFCPSDEKCDAKLLILPQNNGLPGKNLINSSKIRFNPYKNLITY